eukprot:485382_1
MPVLGLVPFYYIFIPLILKFDEINIINVIKRQFLGWCPIISEIKCQFLGWCPLFLNCNMYTINTIIIQYKCQFLGWCPLILKFDEINIINVIKRQFLGWCPYNINASSWVGALCY